jgi:hypothetical protein
MDLQGSTGENLVAAIRSAKRLSGHPVHADTLQHWTELLHLARRQLAAEPASEAERLAQLIAELETELAAHSR